MYDELKLMIVTVILIVLLILGIAVFSANQEARVFNKFKSPNQPAATTWDAMWSDLRIMNETDK